MHQYLNLVLADREVKAQKPEAWAVLLDVNGNLSEGLGSNIFLVRDGNLLTPRERYVLPGVSRQAVIDLAHRLEIPCEEADIDLYDAYTADECFLTSTSLCMCGVRSLNGRGFAAGEVPGPITQQTDRCLQGTGRLRFRRAIFEPARGLNSHLKCVFRRSRHWLFW